MAFCNFIILFIGYLIIILEEGYISRKEYIPFIIAFLLFCWSILSLQRKKIIADDHGITIRMIFKEIFIDWKEIKSVDIKIKTGHGLSPEWKFERWGKPDYTLDFSYGRNNMHILSQALVTKCQNAHISNKVRKFAENKNYSLLLN